MPSVPCCLCLCETTMIVGWMTAVFVLLVSIHSDIQYILGLDCSVLASAYKVCVELFCSLSAVCHMCIISLVTV